MTHHCPKKFPLVVGIIMLLTLMLLLNRAYAQHIPAALETITAEDGSTWERVNLPGFGNIQNMAIDSLCPFQNRLYALTRNDREGCELWRTDGTGWDRVTVPGFTDAPLHSMMQGGYAEMIVFKDRLYVATSSGYEGKYLYHGIACEIWRFDGQRWEAVISYNKDDDESGTISSIAGCSAGDGDTTATFTDAGKSWSTDQWAGASLLITSGPGLGRYFLIMGNTADTLTVQQKEAAFAAQVLEEYTICDTNLPDEKYEQMTIGAVSAGNTYIIATGRDENGFGEIWNKSIIGLAELNGFLYASIGHNYEDGTSIWKTKDGMNWTQSSPHAHGNYHGYDLDGNPTGVCLDPDRPESVGVPVCTSTNYFGKSDCSGTETLYVGSTGSRGCNGNGVRALRLDGDKWNFIIDNFVDANDVGTNENGLGDDGDGNALRQSFQAWQWAHYDDAIFCAIARPIGCRLAYNETGSEADGSWTFVVGADGPMPDGFDGVTGPLVYGSNVGIHITTFDEALYLGTLKMSLYENPIPIIDPLPDGADIWRATGPKENLVWSRITSDGLGAGPTTINFESFCDYNGTLYVAGCQYFGKNPDAPLPESGGAMIYRMVQKPDFVALTNLQGSARIMTATVNWAADDEAGISGYNVYRCDSEKYNLPYRQVNRRLISPSANASHTFTDWPLRPNKTFYYKIEAVSASGETATWGPIAVTTRPLFNR